LTISILKIPIVMLEIIRQPQDLQAVKVLTEEGLLEPLVRSLKNSTEAVQPQNTTQASEIKSDPMKEDLIRRGFSPEEAEAWLQMN
jgi:hypothetical protein